jgi:hypothetical protein
MFHVGSVSILQLLLRHQVELRGWCSAKCKFHYDVRHARIQCNANEKGIRVFGEKGYLDVLQILLGLGKKNI